MIADLFPQLDDPRFEPLLARAEKLDVPIYIHPGYPPRAVHDAYYANLPMPAMSDTLARAGWGWHQETAIHVLRMVIAGTFDRHPRLKVIIGHMGEMLPVMMARIDDVFRYDAGHLQRSALQHTHRHLQLRPRRPPHRRLRQWQRHRRDRHPGQLELLQRELQL